jgi:hypothetical protein
MHTAGMYDMLCDGYERWTAGGSEDRCAVAVDRRIGGMADAGTAAGEGQGAHKVYGTAKIPTLLGSRKTMEKKVDHENYSICYIVRNSPRRIPKKSPDKVLPYRHRKCTNNRHSRHLTADPIAPRAYCGRRALEFPTRILTPSNRTHSICQAPRRQQYRRLADLELRRQRRSVKLEQMKLGTVVGVYKDSSLLVEFGEVVVSDTVGDGHARVFGLLEAVAKGGHDDGAVGEVVNVVH